MIPTSDKIAKAFMKAGAALYNLITHVADFQNGINLYIWPKFIILKKYIVLGIDI